MWVINDNRVQVSYEYNPMARLNVYRTMNACGTLIPIIQIQIMN